ncbi:MAG: hypothetical protein MJE77_03205 [Proteobacteria bacterium]|nr:hypothetical protein [Pseudomonadota bacterium]
MRYLPTLLVIALFGCTGTETLDGLVDGIEPGGESEQNTETEQFRSCVDGEIPRDLPTVTWTRFSNRFITLGHPWHSAQDVVAAAGSATALAGKFSYGTFSKDLEGERIEVWIDDCAGGYRRLGERVTDSDGRIALPLDALALPEIGEYGLYFRVMGDNSDARAVLRVYPVGSQFIVFDIDATLTTSDTELVGQLIHEILGSDSQPEPREGAVAITELRHRDQKYELIYLTGRPYLLDGITRDWLVDLGFPGGTVHLTDEVADSWPSESAVGDYKADFLRQLIDAGFVLYAGYGNATSDIYAYEEAGIAKQRTYILGEHGGESQTVAVGETYTEHIAEVGGEAPANQPFRR